MDPDNTANPTDDEKASDGAGPNNSEGSWRDGLSGEYRKVAEKFLSPAEVVKSYAELERKLGNAVSIPKEDADQADKENFYARVGRPASPEAYEIELPDDLSEELQPDEAAEERQGRFLSEAYRIGLTQEQAQAAIHWYYQEMGNSIVGFKQTGEEAIRALEADLRQEWGADYEKNIEFGRRAMSTFGDPEIVDRLGQHMGDAQVLRMMARIGRRTGEAGDVGGGVGNSQRKSLEKELDQLVKRDDYWTDEGVQARVRNINDQLYGTRPVVGMGQRTL